MVDRKVVTDREQRNMRYGGVQTHAMDLPIWIWC